MISESTREGVKTDAFCGKIHPKQLGAIRKGAQEVDVLYA